VGAIAELIPSISRAKLTLHFQRRPHPLLANLLADPPPPEGYKIELKSK
jgi:hypothetical protein